MKHHLFALFTTHFQAKATSNKHSTARNSSLSLFSPSVARFVRKILQKCQRYISVDLVRCIREVGRENSRERKHESQQGGAHTSLILVWTKDFRERRNRKRGYSEDAKQQKEGELFKQTFIPKEITRVWVFDAERQRNEAVEKRKIRRTLVASFHGLHAFRFWRDPITILALLPTPICGGSYSSFREKKSMKNKNNQELSIGQRNREHYDMKWPKKCWH